MTQGGRDMAEESLERSSKKLEKMGAFFDARLQGYEDHQLTSIAAAREFYPFTVSCLPQTAGARILDLGCGTGLELDFIFPRFPDLAVMGLTRNYRSTPEILSFARRVIEKNHGDRRALVPARPSGPDIRAGAAPDAATEGTWIAQEIMRMVGGMDMHETRSDQPARAFSDIAVLCRTRRQLERLELSLRRADIPCEIAGGDELLSDADVQAALRCLRALVSPDSALFAAGDEKTGALLEALRACGSASPEAAVRDYMRLSGVSSAGLERLAASAAPHRELADFLQALLLGEEGDISRLSGKKTASGAVRLMTLHAAKGLEFPYVFITGLSEGIFPNMRTIREYKKNGEEEERRLMYVAITRAEKVLFLTESEGFNVSTRMNKYPSRFLTEIKRNMFVTEGFVPEELWKGTRNLVHVLDEETFGRSPEAPDGFAAERAGWDSPFQIGTVVTHDIFGEGIIVAANKEWTTFEVKFSDGSTRHLRASFLRLGDLP